MLKVVQLQNSIDSAGSSALRLHYAFVERGIDSTIIALAKNIIVDKKIIYINRFSRVKARIEDSIKKRINKNVLKQYGSFSYPILGTDISHLPEIKNADVIYIHWIVGGFLNYTNIAQLLSLRKPVVIIMHDMWYLTGGCHYSFTCEKYKNLCCNCPMIAGNKKNDLSNKGFNKKRKIYSINENVSFVSPSKWLYNCAVDSFLLKNKNVYYIPNVIDPNVFKPVNKNFARHILNINEDEIVIAFGAVQVTSPYKGWSYLQNALQLLKEDNSFGNITVVIFGLDHNDEIANSIPFKTKFMGFLRDNYSLILSYNAANVFVVPSLADNQPTVVMESLSCGTPVVGFDVGGIPDMISHRENGYLAVYKNSEDLKEGIKFCINNKVQGKILPVFEKNEVLNKHIDLINTILLK